MTSAIREESGGILREKRSGALKRPRLDSQDQEQGERIQLATSRSSRAGTLTFDGDHATIAFERRVRHPVQIVWEALTEPEHLARWYLTKARLDARIGGSIEYWTGPAQVHVTGKILAWEPPRVFEHEWNVEPQKDLPNGEKSVVRWELTPDGEDTLLRFTHRRLTRQTATVFVGGMHAFLDRLENELDGAPVTDWGARINEVRANYPQWGRWH